MKSMKTATYKWYRQYILVCYTNVVVYQAYLHTQSRVCKIVDTRISTSEIFEITYIIIKSVTDEIYFKIYTFI